MSDNFDDQFAVWKKKQQEATEASLKTDDDNDDKIVFGDDPQEMTEGGFQYGEEETSGSVPSSDNDEDDGDNEEEDENISSGNGFFLNDDDEDEEDSFSLDTNPNVQGDDEDVERQVSSNIFGLSVGKNNNDDSNEVIDVTVGDDDYEDSLKAAEQMQVSLTSLGVRVESDIKIEENADSHSNIKAPEKRKHSELRDSSKKPPRLKKTLIAAVAMGFVLIFLFITQFLIFPSARNTQDNLAGNQNRNRNLRTNEAFRIDQDITGRERNIINQDGNLLLFDDETGEWIEAPVYDDALFRRRVARQPDLPPPPEVPVIAQPAVIDPEAEAIRQAAIHSPIERQGGFGRGWTAQNASFSMQDDPITMIERQLMEMGVMPSGNPQVDQLTFQSQQRRQEMNVLTDDIRRMAQAQTVQGGSPVQQWGGNQSINTGRHTDAGTYNPRNEQAGTNFQFFEDDVLFPGTIIHAVLVSRIDTDYPGPIHARVSHNVYDSKTGQNLLIPQGTILQGNYSSSSVGVGKVQIAWESMVVNYQGIAYQVSLGGMAGVDKRGRAGISGFLDDKYFEWLKAAGIITLFTLLNEEVDYQMQQNPYYNFDGALTQNQRLINQFGQRIMDRTLSITPRVLVANGKAVSVAVNAPLRLAPFPAVRVEERYVRNRR